MDPIAIIGTGCRFPGAHNPDAFWELLCNGVDAVTEVPPDRWDIDAFYDPDSGSPGKMTSRWGGFLDRVDQFDAQFFGIAPREAIYMDPQQRLLLEVAWEALENAGQVPEQLARSNTGVFVGIASCDYGQRLGGGPAAINAYMGTGSAFSIAANRLSYALDLRGPSMAIDTACSSSLVAVHLACQSLRSGEANLALAGGVNLLLNPNVTIIFSKAQMMAPDGRCKTFDARANGYVRGEGCGVVVLKRLSDARRDGDPILALIRGSAINQDGRSNGLTAPNGPSQEAVIRQALANAKVAPAQIGYVEVHGTGTALGDPIEATALGTVLATGRSPDRRCRVGSAKTNIGHLEAAAGIAGLIKTALLLHHRQIPPSLHFQTPNPYIPLDKLPLQIQQTLEPWSDGEEPALAGVSSFGFGGTNAHVILEEPGRGQRTADSGQGAEDDGMKGWKEGVMGRRELELIHNSQFTIHNPLLALSTQALSTQALSTQLPYLLPLSARSPEALKAIAQSYRNFLLSTAAGTLPDIGYTASLRRSHHDYRLAIVARNREELIERLEAFDQGEGGAGIASGCKPRNRPPKLVFVFSGQGSQWWAMGRELWQQEPVFRATLEWCDGLLRPLAGWSLIEELTAEESQSRLGETAIAQPALFALQVALVDLWRSWGIEPGAVVGHSVGEVAAAHVAGAISLEDAMQVIFHRGRLMQQGTGQGAMAAVGLPQAEAETLLQNYAGRLSIAAVNSPTSVVLSGEAAALEEVLEILQQRQVFARSLKVNYAFHSPQMEPFQVELVQALEGIQPLSTTIPMLSTVTGETIQGEALDAAYWARNIREPVHFLAAVNHLIESRHRVFLEISPHPVLAMNLAQCLDSTGQQSTILPSLRRHEEERRVMLGALGTLYTLGYPVNWQRLYPTGKCVALPSYPWQRERYWVDTEQTWLFEPPLQSTTNPNQAVQSDNGVSQQAVTAAPEKPEKRRLTREALLAMAADDRPGKLETYYRELLARVMGLSANRLDVQQPLYTLGLDSLMAIELRKQIESNLEAVVAWEDFPGLNATRFTTLVLNQLKGTTLPTGSISGTTPALSPQSAAPQRPKALALDADRLNPVPDNLWVRRPKPNPHAQVRLFCFSYAGAGASIFRSWVDNLPAAIELCPVQLPGREDRLGETPITRISALVKTLAATLQPYLDIPFALFGHSLGALLSFELVRELRRQKSSSPVHLFTSGSHAPQIPDLTLPIHRLPDPEFLKALHDLNGTPHEILQNSELMKLLLPALRADFALIETYIYTSGAPLDCPITAFGGLQDCKVSQENLAGWRDQTQATFTQQMFPGDHFFLHQESQPLLQAIAKHLQQPLRV